MYRSALARPEDWGFVRKTLGWGLVLFLLSGAVTVPEVWAATYHVNAATGNDGRTPTDAQSSGTPWKTLTKALANVTSGDDVQVASGTYDAALGESFPLALQDGVAIEGAGKATTTLSAPGGSPVFENVDTPLSSGTTLTGFTLTHDGSSAGQSLIYLEPTSVTMAPVIDDNAFQAIGPIEAGIAVDTDPTSTAAKTFSATISNNTFDDFQVGLYLSADLEASPGGSVVFSPTVSGNTFTDNYDAIVVTLGDYQGTSFRDSTKILDNVASGSGEDDIYYTAESENGNSQFEPLISGNSFTGAQDDSIYVSFYTIELTTNSPDKTNPIVASPTITNNTIQSPVGDGIEVYYSEADAGSIIAHATISGNKITNSTDEGGIYLGIEEEFYPDGDQTDLDLVIANNSVTDTASAGIAVSAYSLDEDPVLNNSSSTIAGNVVDMPDSTGIVDLWDYADTGHGTMSRVISGNTVTDGNSEAAGIYAAGIDQSGLDAANLDIHDNVVDQGFYEGIELDHSYWPKASQVLASCNTVTNNYRGFVVDSSASSTASSEAPDLGGGGSGSPGLNSFHDNTRADLTVGTDHQFAQSNWWGTTNLAIITSHVDNPHGFVNLHYSSFLSAPPSVTAANDLTAALSGDVITYTATLEGTGQCGCASSTFTAPTPAHTTVVPGSVVISGATGPSVQGEDPVEVWVGALGAGEVVTVTWMVKVDRGYHDDVSEQASFGCTQLAADVASDDPGTAPGPDPTVIHVPSVFEVPTLQTAGLATLIVLLLLAGWFLVEDRRRRLLLMLVLGLSLGALGVRAAVQAPAVRSGPTIAAKAATARAQKARSPEALAKAEQARLARRSLHAAALSHLAVQGKTVRLALSDGTSLSVPRGRLHVRPIKLDKAAKRGLDRKQKRAMQRRRAASRRLENLRPGQALAVKVRYDADGKVRAVFLRPEADLAAAKADIARAQSVRAGTQPRS